MESSWQAKLAKSNINILQVTPKVWVIEFTYHPKPDVFKWCKTIYKPSSPDLTYEEHGHCILEEVLQLRKELEG